MTSHFLAIRVRPANRDIPRGPDGSLPACWLLAEWPPEADEPSCYWLSTCPKTPPSRAGPPGQDQVAGRARLPRAEGGLGLDHFEGRSFTGWHRHVTLAVLAQAFCTMIRSDPKVPAPG